MLDDLAVPDRSRRRLLEEHIFRAAFYTFAFLHLDERARMGDTQTSGLNGWLVRQIPAELAIVIHHDSDFWTRHRRRWEAYGEATLALEEPTTGSTEAELWSIQTARAAPGAVGPLAVAAAAPGRSDLHGIEELFEHLGFVEVVRTELAGMMRHLARGWISPTVRRMVARLGIDLTEPPGAEKVLGEIVLGGAMELMFEDCRSHLSKAEGIAQDLQLPTFRFYSQQLAATLSKTRVRNQPRPQMSSAPPTLQTPTQMAVGFLLADPTMREAWETHRWGLLGAVETSARFPAGLILEILAGQGVDVTELIDGFYRSTGERHFAYYDHPAARHYIESDTLGLLLRLYQHSGQTEGHRRVLGDYLELLHKHGPPDGRLPVWLVQSDQAPAMVLGEGCGTIEANLLLGLFDYQPHEHMSLIMPAARRLLGDYVARGTSVNVNYPQPYARAVLAELIDRLEGLDPEMTQLARPRLRAEVLRSAHQARINPQEAACLIWTCSRPALADLHKESWKTIITRAQSFDGGWPGEPFFFVPAAGGRTMWYSSRLLTTALCFHALSKTMSGG